MISAMIACLIVGMVIGVCLNREDIDLSRENKKLRKENEILWERLQDINKINKI